MGWLGGEAVVRTALGREAGDSPAVERLGGGGLVVRASDAPGIGDREAGDHLPAYRAVARVVRAARLEAVSGPGSGFPNDTSRAWLEAFDAPPGGAGWRAGRRGRACRVRRRHGTIGIGTPKPAPGPVRALGPLLAGASC